MEKKTQLRLAVLSALLVGPALSVCLTGGGNYMGIKCTAFSGLGDAVTNFATGFCSCVFNTGRMCQR